MAIPGVQDGGMAVVVAHPCSMRGKDAQLEPKVLVASVVVMGVAGGRRRRPCDVDEEQQ